MELEDLDARYRVISVPRVMIQPIVENVFEHALAKRSEGGILQISYQKGLDNLSIRIEDDGDQLSDETLIYLQSAFEETERKHGNEEITGLINVNQRLRIRFGAGYGLTAQRSELGGLCIIVKIPWEGSKVMQRMLIVDDEPVILDGLYAFFKSKSSGHGDNQGILGL